MTEAEQARPASRRVRMEEVARVAGVSLATVSRALRHPETVSEALRDRVVEAAARLGYVPSPVAGSLAGARSTPLVGVIVPSLTNSFFARTLERMAATLESADLQMMVGHHDYDLAREERIVTAFAGWTPSALVLTGVSHTRGTIRALSDVTCPVIEMWDLDGQPMDSLVGFSNRAAGRAAGRHFAEKGYGEVAYVGAILDADPRARARADGFAEAVQERIGTPARIVTVDGREIGHGGAGLAEVLERWPDTRAIAFSGDVLAVGALFEAQRRGIRVPEDLALFGYGDLNIAAHTNPGLSTIHPPGDEIGQAVADHILARLEDTGSGSRTVALDFSVIDRGSG